MEEIKTLIEKAFQYVSSVSVVGDDVDKMAIARNCLKKAYSLADQNNQKASDENGR